MKRTYPLLRHELEKIADATDGGMPELDGSPFGGFTFDGFIEGIIVGAVWNAMLDWKAFVAGEIELGGWIETRITNGVENHLAAVVGGAVGNLVFADPTGAALVSLAFYLAVVQRRAVIRQQKLDQYNADYQAALAVIDQRYEQLAARHDDAVTKLRDQFTSGCEAALAGVPAEQDFGEIEQSAAALYPVTRKLVIVAPRGRHFPGLTPGQQRVLRGRLRARRRGWLRALGAARRKTRGGEFLDMLDLLVATNREVLTDAGLLAAGDWGATARRLAAELVAWDRATQSWSLAAEAGIRASLATYQQQGQKLQADFLAARAGLMNERLEALLELVNKSRRLSNRKPVPLVADMLDRIKSGKLSFKPKKR